MALGLKANAGGRLGQPLPLPPLRPASKAKQAWSTQPRLQSQVVQECHQHCAAAPSCRSHACHCPFSLRVLHIKAQTRLPRTTTLPTDERLLQPAACLFHLLRRPLHENFASGLMLAVPLTQRLHLLRRPLNKQSAAAADRCRLAVLRRGHRNVG